ncbi:PREDICTED: DNA ligase 3-like [Branchiostoma belcheri]|uniref:DNA ligase n=1 Tax=Branchiostoma belcheri TaxID=7741 RepID=A0A6P4Z006_BRABE|nr:PREDICTED: DNA ligase 3-like [Branchiostoma belcheri]
MLYQLLRSPNISIKASQTLKLQKSIHRSLVLGRASSLIIIKSSNHLLKHQRISPVCIPVAWNNTRGLNLQNSIHTTVFSMSEQRFCVEYAKQGRAGCKKCKQKIEKGLPRIGKIVPNFFHEGDGEMKQWYHVGCIFETFQRARATTKKIEDASDLEGWEDMEDQEKQTILKLIKDLESKAKSPKKKVVQATLSTTGKLQSPTKKPASSSTGSDDAPAAGPSSSSSAVTSGSLTSPTPTPDLDHKDNAFREFRRLCALIAEEPGYNAKTKLVSDFLKKGSNGDGFKGDTFLVVKLLLPGVVKRVYNLNNKQLLKHFANIFGVNLADMLTDLEQGDVSETVRKFFEESERCPPAKKSKLTVQEVDESLDILAQMTKEDDQMRELHKIAKKCTANDLKVVVRLIKHDLRISAGAKHILEGLDPNAYPAFQASRNLADVVERVVANGSAPGMKKSLSIKANLMTPVLPMLAEACKSVEMAMRKCPNGMYAEIKYDGERVQVHKQGNKFEYFSRSLKPVLPHKVAHFKDYIPKAFPHGSNMILDSEVLLVDTNTGNPLPFGTLGIHKKKQFSDAQVALFVFDCIYYNGETLMDRPISERRKFLEDNMTVIPNRVVLSEYKHITQPHDLSDMIGRVIRDGLEGLVLKDTKSIYEPGKRHWLKVKKDYLEQGAMADTADLVVLGAFYGTGNKGGLMSVFLMGVYDPDSDKWCTVTKCGNGHDDNTIAKLNKELAMVKISKDVSKVPKWLKITKNLVPDFVCADPKKAPVWEITGAEFSKSEAHTADGISIRFPRVTKIRDDKDWKSATNLQQLKQLFKTSKETSDIPDLLKGKGKSPRKQVKVKQEEVDDDDDSNGGASSNGASPVKGVKRKAEEVSPRTPKKSKPMCRYGAACYQTSRDHLDKFDHPTAKSPRKTNGPAKSVLPDVFCGIKLFLPSTVENYTRLRRYFVAYDGDIVPDYAMAQATHVVEDPDQKNMNGKTDAQLVTVDWLWECIKRKQLVPV